MFINKWMDKWWYVSILEYYLIIKKGINYCYILKYGWFLELLWGVKKVGKKRRVSFKYFIKFLKILINL